MEHRPAGDLAPKKQVIRDIATCNAYVGIFAWRYGFIPPECDISITELEYREAYKRGIPTFIFLLDEKVDWPESLREQGVNGERIQNLRRELQQLKWIRYFHNADNLATEVLAALISLTHEKIDKRKPKRIPIPIPEKLIRHFQDRDTELFKLKQSLKNRNLRMILICGRGGMGKTTLIVKLLMELIEDCNETSSSISDSIDSIIFIPLNEKGYRTPDRIVELISRTLEHEAAKELYEVWNQEYISIRERLAELFKGPLVHRRCIIILDNLESVLDEENHILSEFEGLSQFVNVFLEYEHDSTIIATSRRTLSLVREAEIAAIGRRIQIPLDEGLPEDFAIELLRDLDSDGKLGLREEETKILKDLVHQCRFIPRTLEAVVATLLHNPTWTLKTLLENKEYLSRLIDNPAMELFASLQSDQHRLVVQALAVYDKPVSSIAVKTILPELAIDKFLDELFRNLMVNHDSGLFWLHQLDREYAYNQIPDTQTGFSKSELHKRAAGFYKQLRKPVELWKSIEDVEPQLQEFRHLVRAGFFDDACQILNEIDREYLARWGYHQHIIELRLQLINKIHGRNLSGWNLCHLGTAYMDSGFPEEAKLQYLNVLSIAAESNDPFLECRALGNLALAEGRLGDKNKEEILLEKALTVAEKINDRLHMGRWLGNLTDVKLTLGNISIQDALVNFNKAKSNSKELCDFRFFMIWSEKLGDLYITLKEYESSKEQMNAALDISQKSNEKLLTCQILVKLGYIYNKLDDTNHELACYEQSYQIIKEMSSFYQQISALIWLASKYEKMALTIQQFKCYEEIELILNNIEDNLSKHQLLLYLGDQLSENYKEKAIEVFNKALEIADAINDKTNLFLTTLRLANLYNLNKQIKEAEYFYDYSLQIASDTDNRAGKAIVLNEHANLLLNSGKALKASEYYSRALPLLEEMNDKPSQLNILNRMGMASEFLQKRSDAIKYYEKSLLIAREIQSNESEAVALYNIGCSYHEIGDIYKAVSFYNDSHALNSKTTKYKCLISLGTCYYQLKQFTKGHSFFEAGINILQEYREKPQLFYPYSSSLGLALAAVGRSQEAIQIYTNCLKYNPTDEELHWALQDLLLLQNIEMHFAGLKKIIKLLERVMHDNKSSGK